MSEEKASAFAHTSPYCCSRFNVVPDGEFGRGEAWIRWDMEEYYGSDPLFTAAVDGGLPVWVTFVARADERGVYQFHEHESNPAYAASFLSVPKSPAYKKITCPASGTSQACYDTADDTPTEIGYQALKTVCDTLFKS